MIKMLTNKLSAVLAAALFVAASYMSAASDDLTAPTTIVLSQPAQSAENIALNR